MAYTRRELGKLALTALPAAHLLRPSSAFALQGKPDSRVRGVLIGMNMPYNLGGNSAGLDEIIQACTKVGVSGVELRTQPVEAFLGVPANLLPARGGGGGRGRAATPGAAAGANSTPAPASQPGAERGQAGGGGQRAGRGQATPLTPEQEAARKANADELRKWRLSVPMDKVREVRRKFEDAGILIEIVKVDGILTMPDEEIDYEFQLARNLGARAISTEISVPGTKRLGQFADKHKLMVGYHGHATTSAADFETVFSYATHNGANLDIGHFVAGQNTSPVPFIKQHHARITHIHVKDRKMNNGPNVPFGQGDTPIKEVLQVIRDNKWNIQATIEFEYPVPDGSDRMTEIKKSVDYCRAALA
jgi:sugar phosphate isomerase/epimerase